ncbi:helix-turn-helix transcriptional regulator [Streptomyces sp. NPDC059618]|uniref:helix-turn-helix transcriptional regulator n=1 Tax=Streptomyces sp. NPDC059618 TaxID=3346887 RepID=UPI00369FD734
MVDGYGRTGEPMSNAPFVGRDEELRRLDRVLTQLGQGGPVVVDVTGEAGIGKSRLVAEFATRARARGLTVLRGWATEYEQHSPFRPFADAFADLAASAENRLPALAELPPLLRGAGETPAGPGAVDRFGLYRATAAVLGRLGGAGIVLALEDLHWADPASLELVDHLVRHSAPAPFLLVVSRRNRQTSVALGATLTRGADTGSVLRVELGPLPEDDCVRSLAGDLPAPLAAELYEASDGNPLYFLTLLKAHRETRTGPVPSLAAGTVLGERDGPALGLRSLLLDELTLLNPLERRIVEAAAVLGDHATPAMIGSLTASGPEDVIEGLRGLMRRDLVRPGRAGRQLTLRHPLVRALVHEDIEPWRRDDLHRRAAAALAAAGASTVEQAHHVEHYVSGRDQEALDLLVAAAWQSAGTAPATSAHWLDVVLLLLPDDLEHLAARRELTLLRARALGMSGRLKESRNLLHQVMDMPDSGRYDEIRSAVVTLRVRTERKLGHHGEAEALLRRELRRWPRPTPSQTVRLGLELCSCAIAAARFPEVRDDMAGVLAMARSLGDEIGEVAALTLIALGEAYEGDMASARDFAGSAAELVDAMTDTALAELSEYLCVLGWTEVFLERYNAAEGHLDRGLEIVRRTGQVYLMSHFLTVKALIHLDTCRITTALELAEQAESIGRSLGCEDLLAFTLALQAHILLQARPPGRPDALSVAEEAVAACDGDTWWANLAAGALAHAALDSGDSYRAADIVLRVGGDSDLCRLQTTVRPSYLELLTNAALANGRPEEAAHWAGRAREEAERLNLPAQRAVALCGLAQVAAHQGDSAEAARLFTEASRLSARSGAALREARCLLLASPHKSAVGDPEGAAVMWYRGHRIASEGGNRLLVGLAERIRPTVFGCPPEPAKPAGEPTAQPSRASQEAAKVGELTPRENEVLRLVSSGLPNAKIAQKLCVSVRTVKYHISNILLKLDLDNRTQIVLYVLSETAAIVTS